MPNNGIDTPEYMDIRPQSLRVDEVIAVGTVDAGDFAVDGVPVVFATAAPLANMVGDGNPAPTYFGTASLTRVLPGAGGPPETHNVVDVLGSELLSVAGLAQVVAGLTLPYIQIIDMSIKFANQANATTVTLSYDSVMAEVFDATLAVWTNWNDTAGRIAEGLPKYGGIAPDENFTFLTDQYDVGFSVSIQVVFIVREWPT